MPDRPLDSPAAAAHRAGCYSGTTALAAKTGPGVLVLLAASGWCFPARAPPTTRHPVLPISMSDEAHEAPEPPMSAEDEERLRAFHSRASGESARLAREAERQKARHADLRARYGTEAVTNWYADHQAHVDTHPAAGADSSPPEAAAVPVPAAGGLRIQASGGSEAVFTSYSPVGTPYDEAVELTDEETEIASGARAGAGAGTGARTAAGPGVAAGAGLGDSAGAEAGAEAGSDAATGAETFDALGAPVSGPPSGITGVSDYQTAVLCYRRFEAWGRVLTAADKTPTSPLLQLLAADYLQAKAGGSGPAGDERLAAAAALPLSKREQGYLAALRASASADWEAAYSCWLTVVQEYPSDLFAVKRAQFVCLMRGDASRMPHPPEIGRLAAPCHTRPRPPMPHACRRRKWNASCALPLSRPTPTPHSRFASPIRHTREAGNALPTAH
jgi:hypothetical protein